jgi:Cu+-exporting ATPase
MAEKTVLHVQGMTCMDCAKTIDTFLRSKDVQQPEVDFMSGEVRFSPLEEGKKEEIIEGINRLGYHVSSDGKVKGPLRENLILLGIWIFTLPLLLGHMFLQLPWLHQPLVQCFLSLPVCLYGIMHFGKSAWGSIRLKQPNMDVLILAGVISSFVYSCVGWFLHGEDAHRYLFFETGASVVAFVMLGQRIEKYSIQKANTFLASLDKEFPEKAHRMSLQFGKQVVEDIPVHEIRKHDLLQVLAGEKLPADGEVVSGEGYCDESVITGESHPLQRQTGDRVVAGSLLLNGTLLIRSNNAFAQNSLNTLLGLVKEARQKKPAIQRTGDRVAGFFVISVILLSLLSFPVNYFLGASTYEAMMRSLAVVVVSCPCAMGLATPVAMMVAIGMAARRGIVIRNAQALENLSKTKHLVFDKTGTLTTGKFRLGSIRVFDEKADEKYLYDVLYTLESVSIHPLARSVSSELKSRCGILPMQDAHEEKGKGVSGKIAGLEYIVRGEEEGLNKFLVLFSGDKKLADWQIEDEEREGADILLRWFQSLGIHTYLFSGDRKKRVMHFAEGRGFTEIGWEMTPPAKQEKLRVLSSGGMTAMAGDGINDAPALALAGTGIGFGEPGTLHADASDILLLHPEKLKACRQVFKISFVVMRTIRQNLFWAFSYNLIAIPLALTGHMEPMYAALFMSLSDLVVIGNSLLIYAKAAK